ncbi:MAG: hypothetical protein IJ571_00495 [Ruminococcus sp.]|nr:hypothetical protein [Ruminococcus sp.]
MKHSGLLTEEQASKIRLNEYEFPKNSGSFIGKLKYRKMIPGKPCLMCYFLSDDGKKIVLPVWENDKTGRYTPRDNGFCFAKDVSDDSEWNCEYEIYGNRTRFLSATLINSAENEAIFAVKFFLMLIKRAFPRQLIANIAVSKFSLSEKVMFVGKDNQTRYTIELKTGDYLVTREKSGESKEKNTCVLIHGQTFDSISKTYE